jgi:hypothetical protein
MPDNGAGNDRVPYAGARLEVAGQTSEPDMKAAIIFKKLYVPVPQ